MLENSDRYKEFQNVCNLYAEHYLSSFNKTFDTHYGDAIRRYREYGGTITIPLYQKILGKDVFIAAFQSDRDFILFFTRQKPERNLYIAGKEDQYNEEWSALPYKKKEEEIRRLLLPDDFEILKVVSIGGLFYLNRAETGIINDAKSHGRSEAHHLGQLIEIDLVDLTAKKIVESVTDSFADRYSSLKESNISEKMRGHEFEQLWRDILDHYKWKAKKTRISGERNDFTAMFGAQHIVGEVRWLNRPISGDEMRAFANKLSYRSHSVGLMISFNGFDTGAVDVAQRNLISGSPIVLFDQSIVERVIMEKIDPGEIFQQFLRQSYDSLYENADDKTADE